MEVNANGLAFTRKRYLRNRKLVSENIIDFGHFSTELHPATFYSQHKGELYSRAKTFEELGLIIKTKKTKNNAIVRMRQKNPFNLNVITKFEKIIHKINSSEYPDSGDSTPHLFTDYKERLNNILLDYFS